MEHISLESDSERLHQGVELSERVLLLHHLKGDFESVLIADRLGEALTSEVSNVTRQEVVGEVVMRFTIVQERTIVQLDMVQTNHGVILSNNRLLIGANLGLLMYALVKSSGVSRRPSLDSKHPTHIIPTLLPTMGSHTASRKK
jgi:hypothetical protein